MVVVVAAVWLWLLPAVHFGVSKFATGLVQDLLDLAKVTPLCALPGIGWRHLSSIFQHNTEQVLLPVQPNCILLGPWKIMEHRFWCLQRPSKTTWMVSKYSSQFKMICAKIAKPKPSSVLQIKLVSGTLTTQDTSPPSLKQFPHTSRGTCFELAGK